MRLIDADRLKESFLLCATLGGLLGEAIDKIVAWAIKIIDDEPTADPRYSYDDLEAMSIYGYPVKDLAILAQRMHSDGLDPLTLRNSNEDYIAGYKRAYEESNKALEDAINKMVDNIPKDL